MGWENRGRYFTRSHRVDGRIVRVYYGCGLVGHLAALQHDQERRWRREAEQAWKKQLAELADIDEQVQTICDTVEIVFVAAMLLAGYHCHRGEWRRRRVKSRSKAARDENQRRRKQA